MTSATLSRGDGWCKHCSHLGNEFLEAAVLTFVGRATSRLDSMRAFERNHKFASCDPFEKRHFARNSLTLLSWIWARCRAQSLPGVVVRSMLRD